LRFCLLTFRITEVAAALAKRSGRPLLLITAHADEAEEAVAEINDLAAAGLAPDAALLPALESMPGEGGAALDLLAERLTMVRRLAEGRGPAITVVPMPSLMQMVPGADLLPRILRVVRAGGTCAPRELAEWLADAGYTRTETIENPGDFAVRGGVMDIFPPGGALPVRLDFFGDELERASERPRIRRAWPTGHYGYIGNHERRALHVPGPRRAIDEDCVESSANLRQLVGSVHRGPHRNDGGRRVPFLRR
jgi:transcription-repair coupling factor (superfamily II helicase)